MFNITWKIVIKLKTKEYRKRIERRRDRKLIYQLFMLLIISTFIYYVVTRTNINIERNIKRNVMDK